MRTWSLSSRCFNCLAILLVLCGLAQAQRRSRITQPVDDRVRVALPGNVHPLAQPRYDRGAVPDSLPANRMLLLLQRSPERETALGQFLQDAHTRGSARYHKWLTAQQFGELYGPDDSEVTAVVGWLQKQGFSVARVTKGKTAIEFSGNAGQLRQAFGTEIHTYAVNGEQHHANNRDPQIPAALAPVVAGISPLNDFRPVSYMRVLGEGLYDPKTHTVTPEWTWSGNPPLLALAPGDLAVQYDLNPVYNAGITGTGVTIGIIGASDIDPTAVVNYHSMFGLPPLNFTAVIDGSDTNPNQGNWATGESYLDVEVASALAPGAMINLYTAADTSVQSGLLLAAQRAIDDDQAPVLSMSYGECEQALGTAGNQFWASLWEQAAAQGQTTFVSAGDGGSAGCDNFDLAQPAQYGLAVSGFSSSPWNVSVGGTDFFYSSYNGSASAQQAELATYWNLTPTNQPAVSLLQPVPEQPWNRAFGLNLYDGGVYNPSANGATIVGGGGGVSSIYPKPTWQAGKGVPADGKRDIPDVSLFAAVGENASFWLACGGSDGCVDLFGTYRIFAIGGTSASSPAMAAIMALINQKYGPQGQAGYIFYPLAAQHPNVFHDITIGSNDVPCQAGAGCALSSLNDNTKGFDTLGHYYATAGYDPATGLGSVDANLLLQYWNSLSFKPSATALTLSQTSFPHGTPVQVSAAVSGSGATPSGDIGLVTTASAASNTSMGELTLANGAASATFNNLPGGQYQLTAKYTGDTVFAPSSASVSLNVAPEGSTLALSGNVWSNSSNGFVPLTSGSSYPYGTYILLDAQPSGVNAPHGALDGLATGTVIFTDSVGSSSSASGPVNINRVGIAEWAPALALPVGASSLSASYSGDSSFNPSASATPLTFTVSKALTAASLSAPSPIAVGSTTTLSLFVGVPYSGPPCFDGSCTFAFPFIAPPTGTVTFTIGNASLGTVPVVPNTGASGYAWATLNVSNLPIGTDAVTATYSGDANYNSATSSFNVVVEQAPTLSASAIPASITQAEFTAITATVTGVQGMPVPTGTVSFAAPAGSFHNWIDTETLQNGSATSIPLPGEPYFGVTTADVYYNGDTTYGPEDLNITFTVTSGAVSPFALSATPLTIKAGATTGNVSQIAVTPQGGFTGTVYLSCALTSTPPNPLHPPTCAITPSVNITGASDVAATMTISSTAPTTTTTAALIPRSRNGRRWLAASGGIMVAGFFLLGTLPRRNRFGIAGCLLVLLVIGSFAGCGGGSSPGPQVQLVPGTTPGNYTFTIGGALTANGVSQTQATVTVTIQ